MLLFETIGVILLGVALLLGVRRLLPSQRKPRKPPGAFA